MPPLAAACYSCNHLGLPADCCLHGRALGRTIWHDIGLTAIGFRLMMKVMDYNFMAIMTSRFATLMPDFKKFAQPQTSGATKKAT